MKELKNKELKQSAMAQKANVFPSFCREWEN